MAASPSLESLLTTLTSSLTSASASLPPASTLTPPADGISLLDTKNELLLTYLQNLVFLILLRLRANPVPSNLKNDNTTPQNLDTDSELREAATKKLVETRTYLEKGVRPLEGKLRYQIEKLVRAATEAESTTTTASNLNASTTTTTPARSIASKKPPKSQNHSGSDTSSVSASEDNTATQPTELTHRPNPSAFARPSKPLPSSSTTTTTKTTNKGVYKPPRITPTTLPTTNPKSDSKSSSTRAPHALNTYIADELSSAPLAETSIGAGSGLSGRAKRKEEERRGYEEERLVRLPEEGKGKREKGKRKWEILGGDGRGDLEEIGVGDGKRGGGFEGLGGRKRRKGGGGDGGRVGVGEAWGKRVGRGKK